MAVSRQRNLDQPPYVELNKAKYLHIGYRFRSASGQPPPLGGGGVPARRPGYDSRSLGPNRNPPATGGERPFARFPQPAKPAGPQAERTPGYDSKQDALTGTHQRAHRGGEAFCKMTITCKPRGTTRSLGPNRNPPAGPQGARGLLQDDHNPQTQRAHRGRRVWGPI